MKSIGAYEAKTKLGEVLDDVQRGERYIVTKHGVPIAQLSPVHARGSVEEVVRALKALRQGKRFNGSVSAAKASGRR